MMPKPDLCRGCPYELIGRGYCPADEPQADSRLVAWGESPGATEIAGDPQRGLGPRGFIGKAGIVFRNATKLAGFAAYGSEVLASNVVRCQPPGNVFPSAAIADECLRRHGGMRPWAALPKVALGANAVEALTGLAFRGKATSAGITQIRGSFLPRRDSGWLVASVHPSFIQYRSTAGPDGKGQSEFLPLLANDLRRAVDCAAPIVPRVMFTTAAQLAAAWQARKEARPVVSIDVEGSHGSMKLCGVAWEAGVAHVMSWSEDARAVLQQILAEGVGLFHYATHDVIELRAAGVVVPQLWLDTINLAALYDPSIAVGLEAQVLTHVPGSVTWKGLVNHDHGEQWTGSRERFYRELWATVMRRLGRRVPATGDDWYRFYNGLDVAWTLELYQQLRHKLGARYNYYEEVLQPLQHVLLDMGERGLPVDTGRLATHRRACERLERMALKIVAAAGRKVLELQVAPLDAVIEVHTNQKALEGGRKYSRSKELSALRAKRKALTEKLAEGFNPKSPQQKAQLIYGYYGLPPARNKEGGVTTDEAALSARISQLERGTIRPKQGTRDEVLRVLRALIAYSKWSTWRQTYLSPQLEVK